jgi:hypothetical protein
MVAERQDRYPKGTYKVLFTRHPSGGVGYCVINLATGLYSCSFSLWGLLKSIEGDLSTNRFPQSAMKYRTWGTGLAAERKDGEAAQDADAFNPETLPESGGPTFVISVLFRQNATWQGRVQWIEERQTREFRSLNELLSLMDEAECLMKRESD